MRREIADVLRDLRGELNPDPTTRAAGDAPGVVTHLGAKARSRAVSALSPVQAQAMTDETPYTLANGTLPKEEIRRLLEKWSRRTRGRWRDPLENLFTKNEFAALASVGDVYVRRLLYDMRGPESKPAMARLSQVLLRMEAGLIVREGGKIVHRSETAPRDTPTRPTITRRVVFDFRGRPVLLAGDPPPAPRPFPTMMKSWILG